MAIKRKPEWSAEGGERAFGGVGFGRFQSNVVDLARHASATFAGAMALAEDGQTILGLDGDPNLGDVDIRKVPRCSRAKTQRHSIVSRLQPSKPKIRFASEIACQPSM